MLAVAVGLTSPISAVAQTPAPALTGKISSEREGLMEGVLVSAKMPGSTVTTTVVSDAKGEYVFPADRLAPGRYQIAIRAAGYALEGNGAVELSAGRSATADLRLKPAAVTSDQLTNAEWMTSAPGADEMKRRLLNCTDCHSLRRVFESKHSAADLLQVFDRMGGYYPGASDLQPQRLVGAHRRPAVDSAIAQQFAEYLASVNLSSRAEHNFEFKTSPRPSGRATRVIITEYDLPRKEIQAHDVIVDRDGMVWYSHFGEQFLSKLDPKTGKVTDYPIPVQKPNHPKGTLDLEQDADGDIWVGLMYQSGIARFDRASEKMRIYPLPPEWQTDATQQSHFSVAATKVDGKVWVKNSDRSQVMRLDVATGQYENLGTFKNPTNDRPIGIYGIYADQQNNAYILEFGAGAIGKIDAKTGKLAFYPTPTRFSRARRGRVDDQNRLWFAEFGGNAVGMFDPKTERITEWKKPLAWEAPYDVVADRNGEAWEVNESSDRVGRLDPRTGDWTNYLLPRYANLRRVYVDDRTSPVKVWFGNNHAASVIKLEPLD
jgi:streptogramin lyase